MTDPFDQLAAPTEPQAPRPSFARTLRARLVEALDLDPLTATPTIELPGRKPMTITPDHHDRSDQSGFEIAQGPRAGQRYVDGIWSVVAYRDPDAGIRFVTEVLGFQAAGIEVLRPPEEPHYDPGGMGFSVRDPEGNAWSFGTYVDGATS